MRLIIIASFFLIFISCDKKKVKIEKKYPVYIISKELRNYEELKERYKNGIRDSSTVPLPPPLRPKYFYGTDNFILDDSLNIYFYQQKNVFRGFMCGTGMEEEIERDSIPEFKELTPEKIVQIPLNSLEEFLKLNLKKGQRNIVKIASQKDTLNSKAYYRLVDALDKHLDFENDRDVYVIYSTTQEEDTVLFYKKFKKDYDYKEIKWDLNRIKFIKK